MKIQIKKFKVQKSNEIKFDKKNINNHRGKHSQPLSGC